jgi:putative spermidine/putrescine transport system permease protein
MHPPVSSRQASVLSRSLITRTALLLPAAAVTVLVFWVAMAVLAVLSLYPFLTSGAPRATLDAWGRFLGDRYYWGVVSTTLQLGALTTAFALLLGYPVAYAMTKIRHPGRLLLITILLFSPILVSVVVRTYGWMLLLSRDGAVNYVLLHLGVVRSPLLLVFNTTGIVIAMVHILLPFMTFPILSLLNQIPTDLGEAARDLGANRWQRFWRVTLPLSLPGVISGCQIVFTLTISAFVTPYLMGGGKVQTLSGVIYRDMEGLSFAFVSVTAFVLLAVALAVIAASNAFGRRAYARAEATA